jgi:hypothetical protein
MRRINSSVLKPVDFASSDAFIIVMAGAEYEVCEAVERQPPDRGLSFVAKPNNMGFLLDNLRETGCVYVNLSLVRPTLRTKFRLVRRHERFAGLDHKEVPFGSLSKELPAILDECDENRSKFNVLNKDGETVGVIVPGVQTPLPLVDSAISSEDFKKGWKGLVGATPINRSNKLVAIYLPEGDHGELGEVPRIDEVIDESVLEEKPDLLDEACYVDEDLYPKIEVSVNPISVPESNGFDYDGYALFLKAFGEVMSVDHPSLPRDLLRKLGELTMLNGFCGVDMSDQIDGESVHELFGNIVRGFEAISRHRFSEDVHAILYG